MATAKIIRRTLEEIDADMARLIASPSVSHWLKAALVAAQQRDPLDALCDAEALQRILHERLHALFGDQS